MAVAYAFLLSAFMAIFITINPISKVPFFLALTQGYTREERHHVIVNAIKVSLPVMLLFAVLGKYLFIAFGIGFLSMKVLGGFVILKIGWDMLRGHVPTFKGTEEEEKDAVEREMVGVVPLGIPMISGPGAIITVMIFMGEVSNTFEYVLVLASIIITIGITYFLLIESEKIYERIGKFGIQTSMRILGIIIASIGIQMLINSGIEIAGML